MSPDRPKRGTRVPSRNTPQSRGGGSRDEWLYGFHPVREALRARRRKLGGLLLRSGARRDEFDEVAGLAREAGIPVDRVPREEIDEQVGGEAQTQGIALRAGPLPELSLAELLSAAEAGTQEDPSGGVVVALDGVEDPQNVGALARVAESAGAAGLILTDRRAPPLSPALARASAGAIEWLPVARVANLSRALRGAKDRGYWTVAAAPEQGQSIFDMEDRLLTGRILLILGAEGRGVRSGVLKEADHRVWIPMRGEVDSLNVSNAGAILLYDLLRRRSSTRT